jgi:hypothetical protein
VCIDVRAINKYSVSVFRSSSIQQQLESTADTSIPPFTQKEYKHDKNVIKISRFVIKVH